MGKISNRINDLRNEQAIDRLARMVKKAQAQGFDDIAREAFQCMIQRIAMRSPDQVRRMERKQGIGT